MASWAEDEELLTQLGSVLRPVESEPSAAELAGFRAAVADGAVDVPPRSPRVRPITAALVAAGSLAVVGTAAAATGASLPRPLRAVAHSVGFPIDSPDLVDARQDLEELRQQLSSGESVEVAEARQDWEQRLEGFDESDRQELSGTVDELLARAEEERPAGGAEGGPTTTGGPRGEADEGPPVAGEGDGDPDDGPSSGEGEGGRPGTTTQPERDDDRDDDRSDGRSGGGDDPPVDGQGEPDVTVPTTPPTVTTPTLPPGPTTPTLPPGPGTPTPSPTLPEIPDDDPDDPGENDDDGTNDDPGDGGNNDSERGGDGDDGESTRSRETTTPPAIGTSVDDAVVDAAVDDDSVSIVRQSVREVADSGTQVIYNP